MFCKYKTNIAKRKKTISKHPFFYHEAIPLPYLSPLSFPIYSIYSIYSIISIYSILSISSIISISSIPSIPPPEQQEEGQSIRT